MGKNSNTKQKHIAPNNGAGGSKSGSAPILVARCTFPHVFENREKDENGLPKRPKSEVVYSRSDHDGYKWHTTWWECREEKPSAELVQEIDGFQNALFSMPEFGNLDTMRRFCETANRTSDPAEFNLYSETEHFHIWLRMITRFRDYNLYVHYYQKQHATH